MRYRSDHGLAWQDVVDAAVTAVVEPVAQRCAGWEPQSLKPILRREWRDAFRCELTDPALTWCADAIHDGTSWRAALWGHGPAVGEGPAG